jgi:hypothetical protein
MIVAQKRLTSSAPRQSLDVPSLRWLAYADTPHNCQPPNQSIELFSEVSVAKTGIFSERTGDFQPRIFKKPLASSLAEGRPSIKARHWPAIR